MDKLVLHIVFLLSVFIAHTQENLVPNGSFEDYNWCPFQTNNADSFHIDACRFWTSPTSATPDYFNACSTQFDPFLGIYLFSVPENYFGNQPAHSGNAYGAIGFAQNEIGSPSAFSEYVQIEINKKLEAGKFYQLSFFIHNPRTEYCINSVGALFTASALNLITDGFIPLTPQILSNPQIFFCDTSYWYEVKGTFLAKGDEQYLTIGVFNTKSKMLVKDYHGNPVQDVSSYLYIDDVSLIETELQLANIFTPNGDGQKDTYTIDVKELGAIKAEILNRWGNAIVESDTLLSWDGTLKGQQCSEGVYFIRIQFENNTVNGFIHLMK